MTASTRLTSTSQSALKKCLRLYFHRYVLKLSRIRSATPLRFGSAMHKGQELRNKGANQEAAIAGATVDYATCPDWADPVEWAVECETVKALLAGHFWRYSQDNVQFLAVEQSFEIPLVNPDTGAVSRSFTLAGKFDGLVRLPDIRTAVMEYKNVGDDIAPGSEYWLRTRADGQINQYVLGARALGHDVSTVMYDVCRKPSIRLRQNETPAQFGQRLLDDIGERPDFYYQRREVPRLDEELAQFQAELWQQAQQLLEIRRRAERLGDPAHAYFRNVGKMTCSYCEFADLCLGGVRVDPANPPAGFQVLSDPNPELATQGN
jgi:hypothetical protein